MKKWMAFLLAMLMLVTMVAVPTMAEEDEATLPDLSFAVSGEGIAGWAGAKATDLQTDGASPDRTEYLKIEKRAQLVNTTAFIPAMEEPYVLDVYYKSDTASAAAVIVQCYKEGETSASSSLTTATADGTNVWRKCSITMQMEGAVSFKIWLRNLKADATVCFTAPKLRWQSEGNAFLNGDMQDYTESGDVITPTSWNLKEPTGASLAGKRENNGNVYVSMQAGTGVGATYLQQKTPVTEQKAYRLSFKLRGNLTVPVVEIYFYEEGNTTSFTGKKSATVVPVGTPDVNAWTEYEAYLTMQVNATSAAAFSLWLRNPSAGYTVDIDDVSLTASKTNFTFSEAEGNITAKAHMVATAPVTGEATPVLILCAYTGKTLTDVKVVSGTKADIALTAAGQFTANATVAAPTGTVVKAFAWDGIASMKPLGRATK